MFKRSPKPSPRSIAAKVDNNLSNDDGGSCVCKLACFMVMSFSFFFFFNQDPLCDMKELSASCESLTENKVRVA